MTKSGIGLLIVGAAAGCVFSLSSLAGRAQAPPVVIKILAKQYAYVPSEIKLKRGVAYDLQFTTADKAHGFEAPDLNLRTSIKPGKPADIQFTPTKAGSFPFYCNVFCGPGHDDMAGKLIVTE